MAERAAMWLVFGLVGLGMFSVRTKSFPNSPSTSISWMFLSEPGSARMRASVLSAPILTNFSLSGTFYFGPFWRPLVRPGRRGSIPARTFPAQ
jgi:hypothetical protein